MPKERVKFFVEKNLLDDHHFKLCFKEAFGQHAPGTDLMSEMQQREFICTPEQYGRFIIFLANGNQVIRTFKARLFTPEHTFPVIDLSKEH